MSTNFYDTGARPQTGRPGATPKGNAGRQRREAMPGGDAGDDGDEKGHSRGRREGRRRGATPGGDAGDNGRPRGPTAGALEIYTNPNPLGPLQAKPVWGIIGSVWQFRRKNLEDSENV